MFSSISGLYDSNSKPKSQSNSGQKFRMDHSMKSKYSLGVSYSTPNPRSSNIPRRRNSLEPLVISPTRSSISLGMLANVSSPGLSSRIVKYGNENMNWTKSSEQTLTHHPLYKRPGELPQVRLGKNRSLPKLTSKNTQSLGWTPVTIRIAPPHTENNRLHPQENNEISKENSPSKSVLETLREMSRKRIHSQLELSGNSYDDDLNEESAKRECIRDIVPEENIASISKRDREESPNSVSNKSPSSNRIKRFAPSIKGTNEVYASLSSSRNLFEKKIRHSHSGEWSRSSSPVGELTKKSKFYTSPNSKSISIQTDLSESIKASLVSPVKFGDDGNSSFTLKSKSAQAAAQTVNIESDDQTKIKNTIQKVTGNKTPRRKITTDDSTFDSTTISLEEYINQRMKNKSRLGSLLINLTENNQKSNSIESISSSNGFSLNNNNLGKDGSPLFENVSKGTSPSNELLTTNSGSSIPNIASPLTTLSKTNFNSGNLTESSLLPAKTSENTNLLSKSPSMFLLGTTNLSSTSIDKPSLPVVSEISSTNSTTSPGKNVFIPTTTSSETNKINSEQLLIVQSSSSQKNSISETNPETLPSMETRSTNSTKTESQNKANGTFIFDSKTAPSKSFGGVTSPNYTNSGKTTSSLQSGFFPNLINSPQSQTKDKREETATKPAMTTSSITKTTSSTTLTTSSTIPVFGSLSSDAKQNQTSGNETFAFKNINSSEAKQNSISGDAVFTFNNDCSDSKQNPLAGNGGFSFKNDNSKSIFPSTTTISTTQPNTSTTSLFGPSSLTKPSPPFVTSNTIENKTLTTETSKSSESTTTSTNNLFSNTPSTTANTFITPSAFGTTSTSTTSSFQTTPVFGQINTFSGNNSLTTTSSSNTNKSSSSTTAPIFGSTSKSPAIFGQTPNLNSSFTSSTTPSTQDSKAPAIFGQTPNLNSTFTSSTTPSTQDSKTPAIFGQTPNLNSTFTSSTNPSTQDSGFGNSNPSKDIFGKSNISQPFNQTPGNPPVFGSNPNNTTTIATVSSANTTFGTNPSSNVFSSNTSSTPQNIFGSNSVVPANLFSSNNNNNKTTSSLFGTTSTPTFASTTAFSSSNNIVSNTETNNSPFSNANGQGETNKPPGLFSFGVQSSNSQVTAKDPATKSGNLFTFGAKPSEESSPAFNFNAQQSNTTDPKQGGFHFPNSGSGFANQPTTAGFNFSAQAPQPGFTFQAGGPGAGTNMFNIGSGSTAPRIKSSRSRRLKN